MEKEHTPETAHYEQIGICCKCKKPPVLDLEEGQEHQVYDGCLGKLPGDVMNACCGHGRDSMAFIQYWNSDRIGGDEAIKEQRRLVELSLT